MVVTNGTFKGLLIRAVDNATGEYIPGKFVKDKQTRVFNCKDGFQAVTHANK